MLSRIHKATGEARKLTGAAHPLSMQERMRKCRRFVCLQSFLKRRWQGIVVFGANFKFDAN